MGGYWINKGLPMYIAVNCKPENGCKIQDACEARARVMLCLELVKSKQDETEYMKALEKDNGEKLGHRAKV